MPGKPNTVMSSFLLLLIVSCSPSTEDLYDKAYKLRDEGKNKEAIGVFNRIIKRNSKLQDAFFEKGYCHLQDSNYTEALRFFEFVLKMKGVNENNSIIIEMNPEGPFAREEDRHQVPLNNIYYQMAVTKYNMDSLLPSYRLFKYCAQNNFNTGNCYLWQGLIWIRYDSTERACDYFQKALLYGDPEAGQFINDYCRKK